MERFLRPSVVGIGVLALAAASAMAGETAAAAAGDAPSGGKTISVRSERARTEFDRAAYQRSQYVLQGWLASEKVQGAAHAPIVVDVTREEMHRLAVSDCEECGVGAQRQKIGMTKPVAVAVSFADLSPGMLGRQARALAHGAIQGTTDGGFVWSAEVQSPGATALRVHFTGFFLPPNTDLYVYNEDGEAFGPYTWAGPDGSGEFWSNTVGGDTMTVQLRHFGLTTPRDLHASSFTIADVGHIDPGAFVESPVASPQSNFSGCGTVDCVEDATCYGKVTQVATARNAVGIMEFVSGAWIYVCSGGLVADNDTSTQIPYFLSANHCISRGKEAKSLEVFWHYVTATCGGDCYDFTQLPSSLGASIVVGNKTGDFTLMRLNSTPPPSYGVAYLGWSTDAVAYTNGASLYRISHPNAAPQGYSEHSVDTSAPTCTSWPRGSWIYSRDTVGATMGGSSGSPVLNAAGLIVGQLSGACGTNVNDECDSVNNATVDGAFASYYSQVAPYLGGGSSGNNPPTASFTYTCSGLDCDFDGSGSTDSDGTIADYAWLFGDGGAGSGAQVSHSYSSDGTYTVQLTVTDNDNATDSTSQNVTVGGGTCQPAGAACSSSSDCCSLKCTGKRGSKTCK
jgi:PKD repeat protein